MSEQLVQSRQDVPGNQTQKPGLGKLLHTVALTAGMALTAAPTVKAEPGETISLTEERQIEESARLARQVSGMITDRRIPASRRGEFQGPNGRTRYASFIIPQETPRDGVIFPTNLMAPHEKPAMRYFLAEYRDRGERVFVIEHCLDNNRTTERGSCSEIVPDRNVTIDRRRDGRAEWVGIANSQQTTYEITPNTGFTEPVRQSSYRELLTKLADFRMNWRNILIKDSI